MERIIAEHSQNKDVLSLLFDCTTFEIKHTIIRQDEFIDLTTKTIRYNKALRNKEKVYTEHIEKKGSYTLMIFYSIQTDAFELDYQSRSNSFTFHWISGQLRKKLLNDENLIIKFDDQEKLSSIEIEINNKRLFFEFDLRDTKELDKMLKEDDYQSKYFMYHDDEGRLNSLTSMRDDLFSFILLNDAELIELIEKIKYNPENYNLYYELFN